MVGVVAFVGLWQSAKPKSAAEIAADSVSRLETAAEYACKQAVERNLKAPSTAKFADIRAWQVKARTGRWSAAGVVDAQNSFGAMLRTQFACDMKRDSTGDWTIIKLVM